MKKFLISSLLFFAAPIAAFAACPPDCIIYSAPTDPGYVTEDLTPTGSVDVTNQLGNSQSGFDNPTTASTITGNGGGLLETSSFRNFVNSVAGIISKTLIPLVITAGVAVFIWSLIRFVAKATDPNERQKMRQYMIWSLVALMLIFSILGIGAILRNTLFGNTGDNLLPQFAEPGKDQQ